jgi:AAA domain-containing protein
MAPEELIVPIQCEYYALEGLGQLLRNVSLVQQNINPELRLTGIVMTMFDPRTKLSEQVVEEVRRFFGDLVYDNIIPRTVRLSEAPGFGVPITVYDPKSKGAQSYRDLAREVALRPPPDAPMPAFDEVPTISVANLADVARAGQSSDEEDGVAAIGEAEASDAVPPVVDAAPDEAPSLTDAPTSALPADVPVLSEPAERAEPALAPAQPATSTEPAPPSPEPATSTEPAPAPPQPATSTEPAPAPPQPATSEPAPAPPQLATSTEPAAAPRPVEAAPPPVSPTDAEDEIWETPEADAKVRPAPRPVSGAVSERRVVVIDEDAELGGAAPVPKPGGSVNERAESIGATLQDDDGGRRRWRLFRKGGD